MEFAIEAPMPEFMGLEKKDVLRYFEWFMSVIDQRTLALHQKVNASSGFQQWNPDYSPDSLNELGRWFVCVVEKRPRTAAEIAAIAAKSPYPIEIPDYDLSDKTFGLVFDVGIYFSLVFLLNFPTLRWYQILGNKRNVCYGHPALSGFAKGNEFPPLHLTRILAYGIASGKYLDGQRLRSLYDVWSKLVA